MKRKCPQCDFENEEGAKFCSNCNLPLSKQDYDENNPYLKREEKKDENMEEEWIPDTKKRGKEDQPIELISNEEDEENEIKNRIKKEEKIRSKVKAEIEKEVKQKEQKNLGIGCLIFFSNCYFFVFCYFQWW